jgi:hypothetical protein
MQLQYVRKNADMPSQQETFNRGIIAQQARMQQQLYGNSASYTSASHVLGRAT